MKASQLSLVSFLTLHKTQFIIPIYQRDYDWTNIHCSKLLKDIKKIGDADCDSQHFIGSVVFVSEGNGTTQSLQEFTIIDGQQRLTTLTLVLIAIQQQALLLGRDSLAAEVYESYLVNKFTEDGEKIKLQQTGDNLNALKYLIKNNDSEGYPYFSRIIDNFNYFKANINEYNIDTVLNGLKKLMMVEVSLERNKDNAQAIFESLNSTGLDLSESDLIRNYILMDLGRKDQERIYNDYWSPIEKAARIEEQSKTKVSDFIRDYLTLINERIPNKGNVYDEFKIAFPTSNIKELESVLEPIKSISRGYNRLLNPKNESDLDIRRHLEHIEILEIKVTYPLLMKVYEDYLNKNISKQVFLSVLNFIESYMFRRAVLNIHSTGLNKLFCNTYKKIDINDYLRTIQAHLSGISGINKMPKDWEIREGLTTKNVYNMSGKRKLYMLSRLENHNNSEFVEIINNQNITVEHVFPQNPCEQWASDLSEGDYNDMHEIFLHTLGNLTLSGNNGSLANMSFLNKRDLFEKGYSASRLWLNKSLTSLDKWDVENLRKRKDILTDRFLEVWAYPDIKKTECQYEESSMLDILDVQSVTNKKVSKASYGERVLDCTTFTSMYLDLIRFLFAKNPEAFFISELAQLLNVIDKRDVDTLRDPKRINDTYRIESNLSNAEKLKRIKLTLGILGGSEILYVQVS